MSNKAKRISANGLAAYATKGTERALEARQMVGIELTQAELEQVSGGGIWGKLKSLASKILNPPIPRRYPPPFQF